MSKGWFWVALAVGLAAGAPGVAAEVTDDDDDDAVLYLTPREDGAVLPNFTALPPSAEQASKVTPTPILTGSGEIVWKWVMQHVPARWEIPSGTEFSADLHFLRLDRVVPVPDPLAHPDAVGRIKIEVEFLRLSSDASIATGSTTLVVDPVSGYTQAIAVHIAAPVTADTVYDVVPGDAPLFGVKVTMTGQARNQDPPLLLVGSPDAPSRVTVPTFPVKAFRAWEEYTEETSVCNERVLQGLACVEEPVPAALATPDPVPLPEPKSAPTWGAWVAASDGLALLGVVLSVGIALGVRGMHGRIR